MKHGIRASGRAGPVPPQPGEAERRRPWTAEARLTRHLRTETPSDRIFAASCVCGHHVVKILAHLRALLAAILAVFLSILRLSPRVALP
ncbi:hypothetical protein [Cereibacter johrii]|uniref:hypothetical protein n=1 Tax=Cereibacter johrii TaxID=445629 RepID=UPI000C6EE6D7|nr:hypothetical protein [Cereibacter johrii]MEA5163209.1 hypothetical protein [Cereibacter johrii]QCP87896.1 hypothetical protein EYE35_19805 [Cereibacter sphaeroides]RAZ82910.1 hypothetical protein DDV93_17755 [Cereibacter johrii]RDS94745.1 hypothetical protein DWF04_15875 [Cereibacter sphaeroides f. sp. denitrificans]